MSGGRESVASRSDGVNKFASAQRRPVIGHRAAPIAFGDSGVVVRSLDRPNRVESVTERSRGQGKLCVWRRGIRSPIRFHHSIRYNDSLLDIYNSALMYMNGMLGVSVDYLTSFLHETVMLFGRSRMLQ